MAERNKRIKKACDKRNKRNCENNKHGYREDRHNIAEHNTYLNNL